MLFNSYEFIFAFLPFTWFVFFYLKRFENEVAMVWLVVASLFFYGWWGSSYLFLIIFSMLINFGLGRLLSKASKGNDKFIKKIWLAVGVLLNLSCLAYYKYYNFVVDNINYLANNKLFNNYEIILPLAISFFTFQQIAYLADAYKGVAHEYKFIHYALFVTYFPQLIAGPIVHHREMLPQFMRSVKPKLENISVGVTIFVIGLFKKSVLADGIAQYATPIFSLAETYTFQLYFDFSGYCDMAIGASRLFGINLPLNFHSPYKSTSIIEFWRRWHITLSRFLRDYLYIPLGGSRKGEMRKYSNLLTTMLLGGLWHGAGWTFVVWGALHGFYLIINHTWITLISALPFKLYFRPLNGFLTFMSWLITFIAVVVGWVFFRSSDFYTAMKMLYAMAGMNGIAIPNAIAARIGDLWSYFKILGFETYLGGGRQFLGTWLWLLGLSFIAFLFPNTQQIMKNYKPALFFDVFDNGKIKKNIFEFYWKPTFFWASSISITAALGILSLTNVSEFLYFQF